MSDGRPIVVCFPFVGDDLGGSHISAVKLIRGLDSRRFAPLLALHRLDGPLAPFLDREGLAYVQAPPSALLETGAGPFAAARRAVFRVAPTLWRFLGERRAGIVHTNDGRIHAAWSIAARLAGARLLWHHRGDPAARGVNWLAPLLADRIVTVSRFARPSRPIVPIGRRWSVVHSPFDHPAPIDRDAARRAVAEAAGLAPGTRTIAFFGQFLERKRPGDVVRTLAALRAARRDLPVAALFFGADAPGRAPLERPTRELAASLGVADVVRFMGFRYPVEHWMAGIDVLLVPALSEPFGRTLIEAMLLRTPVVAADHGGNGEAIVDGVNGFLAAPRQPEAFVAPTLRLLTDETLRARIVETAYAEAVSRYGVDPHVRAIQAIYGDLAGSRRAPAERSAPAPAESGRT